MPSGWPSRQLLLQAAAIDAMHGWLAVLHLQYACAFALEFSLVKPTSIAAHSLALSEVLNASGTLQPCTVLDPRLVPLAGVTGLWWCADSTWLTARLCSWQVDLGNGYVICSPTTELHQASLCACLSRPEDRRSDVCSQERGGAGAAAPGGACRAHLAVLMGGPQGHWDSHHQGAPADLAPCAQPVQGRVGSTYST
jgi:hypothetical protein